MKKELLKGLSEEQIAKVEACNSNEDILELAKKEGVQLTDEQLTAVSGGGCVNKAMPVCPWCGFNRDVHKNDGEGYYCTNCGCRFTEDGTILKTGLEVKQQ